MHIKCEINATEVHSTSVTFYSHFMCICFAFILHVICIFAAFAHVHFIYIFVAFRCFYKSIKNGAIEKKHRQQIQQKWFSRWIFCWISTDPTIFPTVPSTKYRINLTKNENYHTKKFWQIENPLRRFNTRCTQA